MTIFLFVAALVIRRTPIWTLTLFYEQGWRQPQERPLLWESLMHSKRGVVLKNSSPNKNITIAYHGVIMNSVSNHFFCLSTGCLKVYISKKSSTDCELDKIYCNTLLYGPQISIYQYCRMGNYVEFSGIY